MRISDWSSDVCSSDLSFAAGCTDVKEGLEKADDTLSGTLLGAEGAQTGDSGEAPLTETDLATSLYESCLKLKSEGKDEIGRAHVCTPVTNAHLVCRLMPEKKKKNTAE